MATAAQPSVRDREWFIVGRWQEYEGESRANLLRIAAVGAFYTVQLVHFYALSDRGAVELLFHQRATGIAVAWTMLALAVMLALRLRIFPVGLKHVSSGGDLLLLTALASLAAGAHSPLVLAYFLIIVMAALRLSIGLVWFSALGSMLAYLALVGLADDAWFDARHAVAPTTQLLTLLSLAMTGIVTGQVVRRVRGLAAEYAERLERRPGGRQA